MSKPVRPRDQIWAIEAKSLASICRAVAAVDLTSLLPPPEPGDYEVINGAAVIDICGPIEKSKTLIGWLFDSTETQHVHKQLQNALGDSSVDRIILRIDSPGGTVSGTDDLAQAVYAASEVKPVIAFIEDLGASAAYWIASQASTVYATRSSIVGSVGTFSVVEDWSAAYAAMGVAVHIVKAGRFKAIGAPGSALTSDQLEHLQQNINSINRVFLNAVRTGRGLSSKELSVISEAGTFVGREAFDVGLVDGIRSFESILQGSGTSSHSATRAKTSTKMVSISSKSVRRFGERTKTETQRKWDEAVASYVSKGMSKTEALRAANRSHPTLRLQLIKEANSERRR